MSKTRNQFLYKVKETNKVLNFCFGKSVSEIKKELTEYFLDNPPQNDDELHTFIKVALGINIPRVSVCKHHSAVFDFVADAYFERVRKQIVLANRTGGKTLGVAALNVCEALFKPGCGAVSIGGAKQQAEKCYNYAVDFFHNNMGINKQLESSLMSRTKLRNGSYFKVLASSERSVHHDHVPKVRLDEVELMDASIYEGALSIPLTKNGIRSNLLLTSTRFKPFGLMQKLIDSHRERGYKLYTFCYKDIAENCPDSRSGKAQTIYYINKKARKILSPEDYSLEKDRNGYNRYIMFDKCINCKIAPTCNGDLKRANGWYLIEDLIDKYEEEEHVWDSQWECLTPYQGDLAFSDFDSDKSAKDITYNPNWDTYCSVDFGWAANFYACWFQIDYRGWIYFIDEYTVNKTLTKDYGKILATRGTKIKENKIIYRNVEFHGDPAGKSGNEVSGLSPIEELWNLYKIKVKTRRISPNDRFNFIRKKMSGTAGVPELYIDSVKCPVLYRAFCSATLEKTTDGKEQSENIVRDENMHAIDGCSYGIANVFNIKKAVAY